MSTIMTFIMGWILASVPIGLIVGRLLARASEPNTDAAPAHNRTAPEILPYQPRAMSSGEPLQNGD